MRRWYEPRKDRPDLERSAIRKRGFVGYMDMLWREFFELLKLNLLFVLSCVPIITIPAALTAMHRITSVMVRDENHFLWPDYWKAFRRDFWKSLGGGAAIAAVMALSELTEKGGCIDYYHYNAQPGIYYVRLLAKRFSHLVWLNPMPERSWDYIHGRSSIALLRQEVPMFPLSIDGLDRALKRLMVSH